MLSGRLFFAFMAARNQRVWLFGAIPDLFLGTGLLYLLVLSGLLVWGDGARDAIPVAWISYLVLIVSGSHYGGTLLRVYEHEAERRAYRFFTVYGTVAMLCVLTAALYSPLAGSILITIYLTWSPWHYTGQNYGISVMLLRRRGVEISPLAKRLLHASFVFSFLSVFLVMHAEGNSGRGDPLALSQDGVNAFRFISLGFPDALRDFLMPVVAIGYVVSVLGAGAIFLRAGRVGAVAPAALIGVLQAVWFSVPYLSSHFDLLARIPALGAIEGETYRFYFVWVALGHATQYLWITTYYARADRRWNGYGRYFGKVFVFGNAVWAAPVVLLGPDLLGRPDYGLGLAICVAAAVNIHHFILDGAIWKLRNPKLAAILLRDSNESVADESAVGRSFLGRKLAWSLAGLFCVARLVPYVELDRRFPAALSNRDFSTAESILERAAIYGRDSTALRLRLANQMVKSGIPARSLRHYERSLDLHPDSERFVRYGVLTERVHGINRAILAWERGIEEFPDDFELLLHLGEGYLKLGRPSVALPYLERAVAVRPEHAAARRILAKTQARTL